MRIFLSYSTLDRSDAEEISLALEAQGHDVFFDRTELEGGTDYNSVIREQVQQANLLIYLISAASVRQGSYALTELKFARQKWPHPGRNVLPVLLHPTPLDAIPAYLRSVTFSSRKARSRRKSARTSPCGLALGVVPTRRLGPSSPPCWSH